MERGSGVIPRVATHQEHQAVQEEHVEEADGASHLVGENQTALGTNKCRVGVGPKA